MRYTRSIDVAAGVLALVLMAGSQPALALDLAFQRTWGGPNRDEAAGVAAAADGSIYLAGQTTSFGTGVADGDLDIFLIKYSPTGSIVWQRTYGIGRTDPFANANDFAADVKVAPDGTIWVTGTQVDRTLLVQFDANGNLLSER